MRRRWKALVAVGLLALVAIPFLIPDRRSLPFLGDAEMVDMTVWWSNDKPTWTRYRLPSSVDAVLTEARPILLAQGYKESKVGRIWSFEHGSDSTVDIGAAVSGNGTVVDVIEPRRLTDHLRDFKFQFLGRRGK